MDKECVSSWQSMQTWLFTNKEIKSARLDSIHLIYWCHLQTRG